MNDIDKLWQLWSSGDHRLCIQLIKSQGLDLCEVMMKFWDEYVSDEDNIAWKHLTFNVKNTKLSIILFNTNNPHFSIAPEDGGLMNLNLPPLDFYISNYATSDATKLIAMIEFTKQLNNYINKENE